MLNLNLVSHALATLWLAHRHWLLRRGVRHLAEAVRQRRPFLGEDQRLPRLHASWGNLVSEVNHLVRTVQHLGQRRADQLAQLETALGNLQEAVLVVDSNNYILLANRALNAIFPDARGTVGRRVETVLRSADFLQHLDLVRDGQAAPRQEIAFEESGGTVWVEVTGVMVPQENDANEAWTLFVLHDITRERQLENVRREFVANVSHELKTPLSVIKGFAETLAEDHATIDAAQREQFAQAILRHAERLTAIVEDLLTLSRLESASPGMQPVVQDLGAFLSTLVEEFAGPVSKNRQRLELAITADQAAPLLASVDPLRLTQVVSNLVDNARKYTPAGTAIEVGARAVPAEHEIEIWVRDNGPGIPAADLPRIFERFYRVEKGRARGKGGTGLGLSIVKHIVQLHGGRVWAESEAGQGTRIAFRLPAVPAPRGGAARGLPTSNDLASSVARS
jgi:two-component system phosphate regulon sensor histidine kinase PhoR